MDLEALSSRSDEMQRKGMSVLDFLFTGLKIIVAKLDYKIDSRIIKRSFRFSKFFTLTLIRGAFGFENENILLWFFKILPTIMVGFRRIFSGIKILGIFCRILKVLFMTKKNTG